MRTSGSLSALRRGSSVALATVAQHHGGVTQESAPPRACDRARAEAAAELVVIERHQAGQERHQRLVRRRARAHVPRAYLLTDVASENPVAEFGSQRDWNRPAMLDRQVRDTHARLDNVALGQCARRAQVEALTAGAAMLAIRFAAGREFGVGENF